MLGTRAATSPSPLDKPLLKQAPTEQRLSTLTRGSSLPPSRQSSRLLQEPRSAPFGTQHTTSNSSCPWEEQPGDLILHRADGHLQGRLPGLQRIPGDAEAGSGMRLCCCFFPPRGGEQVLAACFLLPPGDLLLTGETPPGALQLSREETPPKRSQLFWSFPSFLDSPFGVRFKSNSSLGK